MIDIIVATEDELSETLVAKLLLHARQDYQVQYLRENGFGYLKRSIRKFNQLARYRPVLLLTDSDKACVLDVLKAWFPKEPPHPNLLFRLAVREVESCMSTGVRESETINLPANAILAVPIPTCRGTVP